MIKAIGEGAFGKAYLAKGKSDSKHCVIKEINFEKVKLKFLFIFSGIFIWLLIQFVKETHLFFLQV